MAGISKVVATISLMLMLLFASDMMTVAEARSCDSLSKKFKGICVSSTNCRNICRKEGFTNGECRGFRRRCFCTKKCPPLTHPGKKIEMNE